MRFLEFKTEPTSLRRISEFPAPFVWCFDIFVFSRLSAFFWAKKIPEVRTIGEDRARYRFAILEIIKKWWFLMRCFEYKMELTSLRRISQFPTSYVWCFDIFVFSRLSAFFWAKKIPEVRTIGEDRARYRFAINPKSWFLIISDFF